MPDSAAQGGNGEVRGVALGWLGEEQARRRLGDRVQVGRLRRVDALKVMVYRLVDALPRILKLLAKRVVIFGSRRVDVGDGLHSAVQAHVRPQDSSVTATAATGVRLVVQAGGVADVSGSGHLIADRGARYSCGLGDAANAHTLVPQFGHQLPCLVTVQ